MRLSAQADFEDAMERYIKRATELVVSARGVQLVIGRVKTRVYNRHFPKDRTMRAAVAKASCADKLKYRLFAETFPAAVKDLAEEIQKTSRTSASGCLLSTAKSSNTQGRPLKNIPRKIQETVNDAINNTPSRGASFGIPRTVYSVIILLLNHGMLPSDPTDQASHLCGNNKCINPDHAVWESPARNAERDMCRLRAETGGIHRCTCSHEGPRCIFPDNITHANSTGGL